MKKRPKTIITGKPTTFEEAAKKFKLPKADLVRIKKIVAEEFSKAKYLKKLP